MWYVVSSEINSKANPYPQVFLKVIQRTANRKTALNTFYECIDKAQSQGYGAYEIWDSNYDVCTCVMRDMEDSSYLYAIKMYREGMYK